MSAAAAAAGVLYAGGRSARHTHCMMQVACIPCLPKVALLACLLASLLLLHSWTTAAAAALDGVCIGKLWGQALAGCRIEGTSTLQVVHMRVPQPSAHVVCCS